MKAQKETQEQLFVLHCKHEAIVSEEVQVSKPPLLSPMVVPESPWDP